MSEDKRGDGYRHVFPIILKCVCMCVCVHAVTPVSSGPAHVSVGQTEAADGHAETCSLPHTDIFGLL